MDKIRGWEGAESWVGSKFAANMWIYTKAALPGGQILDKEQEEYLRKRVMSIMLCTKLGLCRYVRRSRMGVVKDNYPPGVGNFKHGTGFHNRCPVCCTMEPSCISVPTNLNRILGSDLKIQKCHEVVNHGRYCETIWKEAHTEVVHVDFGGWSLTTHTLKERN